MLPEILERRAEEHLTAALADRDRTERVGHSEGGDHPPREPGRGMQVIVDTGRQVTERESLTGSAGHHRDQLQLERWVRVHGRIAIGEHVCRGAELTAASHDRQLPMRCRLPGRLGHDGM